MKKAINFFKAISIWWFDTLESIFLDKKLDTDEPVKILKLGNDKFLSDVENRYDRKLIRELAESGQKPHAIVVACSDSRVAPERLFNAELGDLFIVRTAGNVVSGIAMGSIEYAVKCLEINTIIVMGHRKCGAVAAAASHEIHVDGSEEDLKTIIDIISPSIKRAMNYTDDQSDVLTIAENFNILNTVKTIKKNKTVSEYIKEGKVKIIAAKVDISTGKVAFFD